MFNLKTFSMAAVLVLTTAFASPAALAAGEVNLYSARKENLIKPLLDRFSQRTGIEVNLVTGKDDALLSRLQNEGRNSPADMLITVDAGRLYRAKVAGLLQPVESQTLAVSVPAHLRDPDNTWYGLSVRSRVIVYSRDRVDPASLSTYEALAEPQWKGRLCIRSSSNIYNQSLLASMIATSGENAAETWARKVVSNFARPPQGNDRAQVKAVAAGICDLAVVNTYYIGTMLTSKDASQREAAEKVAIYFPNQGGRGAHVNVSGAGVTRYAPNRDNAVRLLEFLVSDEAQQWYAETNNEYPVKPGVAVGDRIRAWGYPFRTDTLNLSRLGELNAAAVKVFDRAGWR